MIRGYSFFLACILSLVGAEALSAADVPLAAKVNGVPITQERFKRTVKNYLQQRGVTAGTLKDPKQMKDLKEEALEILITQELLWQDAKKKGVTASEERIDEALAQAAKRYPSREVYLEQLKQSGFTEESYKVELKHRLSTNQLIQKEIAKDVSVSDEEVHEFYVANPKSFTRPETIQARHILIKFDAETDEATKKAAKEQIDKLLAEAKGGADFAELAKKHSQGPSAARGGDLGYFGRGRMVPAFESAAFALEPGGISEVVETQFGYHVIKLEDRKAEQLVAEEDAQDRIRKYLLTAKTQKALQQRVKALREEGSVEVLVKL